MMLSETPPEGLLDWVKAQKLNWRDYFIYRAGWQTDPLTGLRHKCVDAVCSACGETVKLSHVPGGGCGHAGYSAPFGFMHPVSGDALTSGDRLACPMCGEAVEARHVSSAMHLERYVWPMTAEQLGGEIRLLTRQARQMVLEYGIQIGYRLQLAKDKVGEDFAGWVERETEISKSSAYRFIKLYNEYGSAQGSLLGVENIFPTLGKISVSNALRLLAVPEEEREEFAREVDAEHISARDLEEAIRERDEARKSLETADRELGEAQKALRDAEAELAETKDALEDQRVKREDAEDAAQKMEVMLREAESRPVEVAIDETAVQKAVEEAKATAAEEKKKAVAELEKRLKAAEAAAKEAGKTAGAAAEKARAETEELRKRLAATQSGANEVILLVKLAQENFNLAVEKLHVMKSTDGETADKLLAGTKKILETLIGRCG